MHRPTRRSSEKHQALRCTLPPGNSFTSYLFRFRTAPDGARLPA